MAKERWSDPYLKVLDKAIATVNSPGGDLRDVNKAAQWIWDRLQSKRAARGYSLDYIVQVCQARKEYEARAISIGPTISITIPLSFRKGR